MKIKREERYRWNEIVKLIIRKNIVHQYLYLGQHQSRTVGTHADQCLSREEWQHGSSVRGAEGFGATGADTDDVASTADADRTSATRRSVLRSWRLTAASIAATAAKPAAGL